MREPDIAYTSADKIPLDADIPGYAEAVPDLVAEAKSPSDSRRCARQRGLMRIGHGVPLAWVLYPETRTIEVHRPGRARLASGLNRLLNPDIAVTAAPFVDHSLDARHSATARAYEHRVRNTPHILTPAAPTSNGTWPRRSASAT